MVGAGLSGQLALMHLPQVAGAVSPNQGSLQDLAVGPGVAPWVSGRVGIPGSNEGGLTYSGHALRLDFRHVFPITPGMAVSLGLGGTAIIARGPSSANAGTAPDASAVYGGGGDVPLLIGWRSASDLYSIWFGPRGGFDILGGSVPAGMTTTEGSDTITLDSVSARHFYGGLVAGMRVGFRHVHLAIELDAAYHHVDGTFQPAQVPGMTGPLSPPTSTNVQQFSLTPAAALEVTF
jgi:hypothetical protein